MPSSRYLQAFMACTTASTSCSVAYAVSVCICNFLKRKIGFRCLGHWCGWQIPLELITSLLTACTPHPLNSLLEKICQMLYGCCIPQHKLAKIVGESQKATQLVHICWRCSISNCCQLSCIQLDAFTANNVPQILDLWLIELGFA